MKTRIFNLIILDESGSMQSIKQQAINGVNETLQTIRSAQRKYDNQEQYVSFVSFNSDAVKTILECAPISEARDITDKDYTPDCCTPLYDAMGQSITALRRKVADDDKVLVTIITDGYENASREYNGKAIKSLIDELKKKDWLFAYIGANQDAIEVARAMSIDNALNFEATDEGTTIMSHKLSDSVGRVMFCLSCKDAKFSKSHFFDDDEDSNSR